LDTILRKAQERNRAEGLSGLLIYDQGCFFQWLEGPKLNLARVWDSIRRDPRHRDIKVLRQETLAARFFAGWDMRLARRTRGDIDRILKQMEAPQELLSRMPVQPAILAASVWDQLITDVVIPTLRSVHPGQHRDLRVTVAGLTSGLQRHATTIWHAHRDAGADLARTLLSVEPLETERFIDSLLEQGADLEPLFHEVFEPAARCLGGSWDDDACDDFTLTVAMGRLQIEARRLGSTLGNHLPAHSGHTMLVALQPGEDHGLNAAMGSELLMREGWDVSHEFPRNDNMLRDILHEQWFDVLDISQSAALLRDHRLPALRFTILAARAASLNPALAVIVDGRSFFERPQAYLEVGADIGCGTSLDLAPAAQLLLDTAALRHDGDRPRAAIRPVRAPRRRGA
jgi:hypothetical protein